MTSLGLVFLAEVRSLRRERGVWILIAALAALMAYATTSSWSLARADRAVVDRAVAAADARRTALIDELRAIPPGAPDRGASDPRHAHGVGADLLHHVAALPEAPLAVVAVGQRDVLPQSIRVTTRDKSEGATHDDGSSPSRRASGPFDPSFVLVFLVPLVVLALAYDLLSGERERGTLALVLSQPVSLATFVVGKALARATFVLLVVLVLGLAPPVATGALGRPGGALALALLAALLVAYTAFWFALALAVDAWVRTPAASALTLVGAWLLLAFVVPGLAAVAVEVALPTPSRVELVNLSRDAAREAESSASALEGDHGKAPPRAALGQRAVDVQARLDAQLAPVLTAFDARRAERDRLVDQVRFLSPAMVLADALADVAGTGVSRHRAFERQADTFQAELRAFFAPRIRAGTPLAASDLDAVPRFRFEEPPVGGLVGRTIAGTLSLVLAAVMAMIVARAGLRRPAARAVS